LSFVVSCQVCLATLCTICRSLSVARTVQDHGQRVHRDWSSKQRVYSEKARKKSVRRGFPTRTPYAVRPLLVSCYSFKATNEGLEIPITRGKRLSIPLTRRTLDLISQPGVTVRSFTLTQNRLSLSIAQEAAPVDRPSRLRVLRRCGP